MQAAEHAKQLGLPIYETIVTAVHVLHCRYRVEKI